MSASARQSPPWTPRVEGRPFSRRTWLIAAVVVLLAAAALRLVALHQVPPGLSQDEVLNADIVQFIRGGEHAFFFPYGFGHEPLYHYFSVPFQVLLGDNILSIRLPALFLGLLLVALTMRWARQEYGRLVGLVTGAGLAVSWWAIVFSRVGIRPILEPVLLVMAALLWPFAASRLDRRVWVRGLLAALFLGLTLYSYTAARVLFALPLGYLIYATVMSLYAGRRTRDTLPDRYVLLYRTQAWLAAAALIVMGVIYVPLFLTLHAQPELQQRVEQLAGPLSALQAGDPGPVLSSALATLGYFGVTGDPRWTYGLPDVPLFGPLLALVFLGGLGIALLRWRHPATAFVLIWLGVTLVPSAITPDAPSSVRLVGALPVVYLMPGLLAGASDVWLTSRLPSRVYRRPALVAVVVALVALYGGRTVQNGFLRWSAELETRLRYQAAMYDMAQLMDELDPAATSVPVLTDGFVEPIDDSSFQRSAALPRETRWIQSGGDVAGALVWPGGAVGGRDGPLWLLVPEYAPLSPELVSAAGLDEQPLRRTTGLPSIAVYEMPPRLPEQRHGVGQTFVSGQGENATPLVELSGYAMLEDRFSGTTEQALQLVTTWNVLSQVPTDLALFVHLIDSQGQVIAQHDGLDASAYFLQPGDALLQRHIVPLPEGMAAGEYRLVAGVYQRFGQRLLTSDGSDWIQLAVCLGSGAGTLTTDDCLLP